MSELDLSTAWPQDLAAQLDRYAQLPGVDVPMHRNIAPRQQDAYRLSSRSA